MVAVQDWVALFYLCGNTSALQDSLRSRLDDLTAAGAGAGCGLTALVQVAHPTGTARFIISGAGQAARAQPAQLLPPVNTGQAAALSDFLRWAWRVQPARRMALVLVGACPPAEADWPHPIAFCYDAAGQEALTPDTLRQGLVEGLAGSPQRAVDLLLFDIENTQYLELAYQLSGVAGIVLGSQEQPPAWPCRQLLRGWQTLAAEGRADPAAMARAALQTIPPPNRAAVSALNLDALARFAPAFDGLTSALMQSLGDDLVWRVMWRAETQTAFNLGPIRPNAASASHFDMAGWLQALAARLREVAQAAIVEWWAGHRAHLPPAWRDSIAPAEEDDSGAIERQIEQQLDSAPADLPPWLASDYRITQSQRQRARQLATLAEAALNLLTAEEDGLILTRQGGLNVFCPPNLDDLRTSPYLHLAFNRNTHWAALLGAVNLIAQHPRALWRLAGSLLTTAPAPVKEDLLRRLIGPASVMVGYRTQFQVLAAPQKLSLSLEALPPAPGDDNAQTWRLRLESPGRGATVVEQRSRVQADALSTLLAELTDILYRPWVDRAGLAQLTALGQALGEDLIQNLTDTLAEEHRLLARLSPTPAAPHLQLQLPRPLMRYPWELLHDGAGMLGDRFAVGRQIFMEPGLSRPFVYRKEGKLRVLVIGDPRLSPEYLAKAAQQGLPDYQLPDAEREAAQIAAMFEQLAATPGSAIDFEPERDAWINRRLTKAAFRTLLRSGEYDLIHFAGHAVFNAEHPTQSAWILSDGPLWAQEIRNTLARVETPPRLVFANACQAAMDGKPPDVRFQGDVFGPATAFVNQGAAAYIGPLWPINDTLALQMALDFYQAMLLQRRSLGQALHFARTQAKQATLPTSNLTDDTLPPLSPQIGLGWAGMVLYGDPTANPMASLWTPHHLAPDYPAASAPAALAPQPAPRQRPRYPLQPSTAETVAQISGPGMELLPLTRGGDAPLPVNRRLIELVEVNGLRHWQIVDTQTGARRPLSGSATEKLTRAQTTRRALGLQRGAKDYLRIIGRWLVGRADNLVAALAAQYDRDMVPVEQLLHIQPDGAQTALPAGPWQWLNDDSAAQTGRVLLIIHGTFSKTASPVKALKGDFLDWAGQRYRGIVGFDHWTLTKSPEENARFLWNALDSRLKTGSKRLDIITHSRGGLVARALVELLGRHQAVNKVIFVATPNSGTSLADPVNWGQAADTLVNMIHTDQFSLYGRLSGFLVQLLTQGDWLEGAADRLLQEMPGLYAQNPRAVGPDDFLGRLQRGGGPAKGVTCAAVAANYEPRPNEINYAGLLARAFRPLAGADRSEAIDSAADNIFAGFNDLIVDTPRVWAVDKPKIRTTSLPPWLAAENLLVFNPDDRLRPPPEATRLNLTGVHHTNIFYFPQTQAFLKRLLLAD